MYYDAYTAIEKYFRNNWYKTGITYENYQKSVEIPFVRISMLPLSNARSEIGTNGSDRFDCIMVVDIFTELNKGAGESIELVSEAMSLFPAGLTVTTDNNRVVHFKSPLPLPSRVDEFSLYQSTIHCPWFIFNYGG